jgi:hypothetical protein
MLLTGNNIWLFWIAQALTTGLSVLHQQKRANAELLLFRIACLTGTHVAQRIPLVHSIAVSIVPQTFYSMIPNLLDLFDLKMLGRLYKKQRSVKRVHISMSIPTDYARAIFPQAKKLIF